MGRDRQGFHTSLVFFAGAVYLCQDHSKSGPFPGTDVFQSNVKLDNTSLRLQKNVSQIQNQGILAPA